MPSKTKKSTKTIKIRTVKNRIISNKKTKGIKYTVEPLETKTRDPSITGDIFKKYKNGVLVKQVFVSKNKLKELIEKTKKNNDKKKGGVSKNQSGASDPQKVEVSDNTSFAQYVKMGFGFNLGALAVSSIFEGIFGDN
jgi:hypothetical protein